MNIPDDRRYTESHEWMREVEEGVVEIGITDFAQSEMGDLVFIDLPEEGDEVEAGESFADAESVKAVSEIISPVSGVVAAVNEDLLDDASLVNSDPYGAWFIRVEVSGEAQDTLDASSYQALCAS